MRDGIIAFLAGAIVAGSLVALVMARPAADGDSLRKLAEAQAELLRQQAQLDRRLAAFEQQLSRHPLPEPLAGQSPAAAPASPPTRPTPEQQLATQTGSAVVERAIASGIWTRHDAAEFSAADDMDGETRLELRRQIAVAINEDRLKVEPGAEFRW